MLSLYRRHARNCTQGHPFGLISYEPDERRKTFKRCSCPIYMAGTLKKKFDRRTTKEWEWSRAHTKRELQESVGWGVDAAPMPLEVLGRKTVGEACSQWENMKLNPALEPSTAYLRKIPLLMRRLQNFSAAQGILWIDQWTLEHVEAFRFTWPQCRKSAGNTMTLLREFFRYVKSHKWATDSPAAEYKEAKPKKKKKTGAEDESEKKPFTEAQMEEMLSKCGLYGGPRHKWTGQDVWDFMQLSAQTGLRISDVVRFDIYRLFDSGEINIRATKNNAPVTIWVEPWVQDMIRARAQKFGPKIFGTYKSKNLDTLGDNWRRKCKKVWKMCGCWSENDQPHPHRFRHTLVRRLLQKEELSIREIADLIGDTEETVREHYSQWVTERQNPITQKLKQGYEKKQAMTGKVVPIKAS